VTDRSPYGELRAGRIMETIAGLERRISEHFPDAGLRRVSAELRQVATECRRPLRLSRRRGAGCPGPPAAGARAR
jgi:hypothetical protein